MAKLFPTGRLVTLRVLSSTSTSVTCFMPCAATFAATGGRSMTWIGPPTTDEFAGASEGRSYDRKALESFHAAWEAQLAKRDALALS